MTRTTGKRRYTPRQSYTPQQRADAVAAVMSGLETSGQVARRMKIRPGTVYQWVGAARKAALANTQLVVPMEEPTGDVVEQQLVELFEASDVADGEEQVVVIDDTEEAEEEEELSPEKAASLSEEIAELRRLLRQRTVERDMWAERALASAS
ncbi:transposase [Streptosporangium sandarakinum]